MAVKDLLVLVVAFALGAGAVLLASSLLTEPGIGSVARVEREGPGEVAVQEEPSPLARGQHLVDHVLACGACHGADLGGGVVEGPDGATIWAPDLTATGVGPRYDGTAWRRVLTEGIGRGGLPLRAMPVGRWGGIAPADLDAVVAWLRTLEGPGRPAPRDVTGAGWAWWATEDPRLRASPEPAPEPGHGAYLAALAGCLDCHGVELGGAPARVGQVPAPSLRGEGAAEPGAGAAFGAALRRGEGRDGAPLDEAMPWRFYAGLHDTEVDALWSFVRSAQRVGAEAGRP